ncbi:hypothetical protein OG601_18020 [Streptomyces sp. NBC_01239]|uniref:hypothetical protein n=1 Tax=unclassified Streptomyces TaxID=2593676 RepID=UPI0022514599|nr:hypothetical protein [Streptomyces sp. NBC_01239]MCX4812504.1 hypothetical protein [Streptomyces sp. NBC_01239]
MLRITTKRGFWCECWTRHLEDGQPPTLFGSYDAHTETEANNWVSEILRTISPALDSDASQEAWERLYDHRVNTRRALLRRVPWTVSVIHARTLITWTVSPVTFLPLAHRYGTELPSCAHEFKPHAAP